MWQNSLNILDIISQKTLTFSEPSASYLATCGYQDSFTDDDSEMGKGMSSHMPTWIEWIVNVPPIVEGCRRSFP